MRRAAAVLAAALVLASCTGSDPGPDGAAPATTAATPTTAPAPVVRYVALGDSYTAGEGLPPFDTSTPGCHRSEAAYPWLVKAAGAVELTSRACAAATTAHVTETQQHPGVGLQIEGVVPGTDLVSITIGGNDLGFAPVMTECIFSRIRCTRLDDQVEEALDDLGGHLRGVYAAARARAPEARLIVVGYPQPIADPDRVDVEACPELVGPFTGGLRIDEAEVRWIREKGDRLGDVVRAAADHAGAAYVDAAAAFAGHEACTPEPWVAGIVVPQVALSFHPTTSGHAEVARLVSLAAGE